MFLYRYHYKKTQLIPRKNQLRTEILAGLTNFFSMSYILVMNPLLLGQGHVEIANGVLIATCLSAAFACLFAAFWVNLPIVFHSSIHASSLFGCFLLPTVAGILGDFEETSVLSYQICLSISFLAGLFIVFLTIFGYREKISQGIPEPLKSAVAIGLGVSLAYYGVERGGLISSKSSVIFTLSLDGVFTLFGLVLVMVLVSLEIKGGIFITIVVVSYFSFIYGNSQYPYELFLDMREPFQDFLAISFLKMDVLALFSFGNVFEILFIFFSLLTVLIVMEVLESIGVFVALSQRMSNTEITLSEEETQKLFSIQGISSMVSGSLGSCSVTMATESSTGMAEGGRTGLTSFVTGICFLLAIFSMPLLVLVPDCAVAPVLIYAGYTLMTHVSDIDFSDVTEGLPAFLTMVILPFSGSVSLALGFGLTIHVLMKCMIGKRRSVSWISWFILGTFLLKYIIDVNIL